MTLYLQNQQTSVTWPEPTLLPALLSVYMTPTAVPAKVGYRLIVVLWEPNGNGRLRGGGSIYVFTQR